MQTKMDLSHQNLFLVSVLDFNCSSKEVMKMEVAKDLASFKVNGKYEFLQKRLSGRITKFDTSNGLSVPHIGWNTIDQKKTNNLLSSVKEERFYFVHSYRAEANENEWILATSTYGISFVSAGLNSFHSNPF